MHNRFLNLLALLGKVTLHCLISYSVTQQAVIGELF